MFSIPYAFANEDDNYITMPAMKRFAKEKKKDDLKTTVDRPQLIEDIENYANQSEECEEEVLNWLDQVLIEGIKEVQVRYLDESFPVDLMMNDEYVCNILNPLLVNAKRPHLCGLYSEELKLFRYEIVQEENQGRCIKLYMGKLLCTFDKKHGSGTVPYPIYIEIYLDKMLITARAKSKAGLYQYMPEFLLERATTVTAEKEMRKAIKHVCGLFAIQVMSGYEASNRFRKMLYIMLERYTKTPVEILMLMESKTKEIKQLVASLMNDICGLPGRYSEDVESNVLNMVEKYFSINYSNKRIFTEDRDAYPLRLNATDEEDSKVEQTAAFEEPLQSKAIFFDNKKMLQKSQSCDGVVFMFKRLNTLYFQKQFKVKIIIDKEYCTLKFTEYTMEEDIVHVLFSLIGAEGVTE